MPDIDKSAVDKQLGVNESGDCWQYPSASSSGYVEIELPTLPGSLNPVERLHMRDFGTHLVSKIESAFNKGYLKTGPQQGPAQVLAHYAACVRGASLMDEQGLARMEILAHEFEKEPEKQAYFEQVVKPYLLTLTPKRR